MKTAVSAPDEIFQHLERLARKIRGSRNQIFSEALREYLARHVPKEVTGAVDRVCAEIGQSRDESAVEASRKALERVEW